MINCEKASELTSKKIDIKLSFMEKMALKFHTMMCSTCALFEEESNTIAKALKHEHNDDCKHSMSIESKEKLKKILENQN